MEPLTAQLCPWWPLTELQGRATFPASLLPISPTIYNNMYHHGGWNGALVFLSPFISLPHFSSFSFLFVFLESLSPFHYLLYSVCLLFLSPLLSAWTWLNFTKCRRCNYQQQRAQLTAGDSGDFSLRSLIVSKEMPLAPGQKEVGTSWHLVNPGGKLLPKIDVPAISIGVQKAPRLRE